MNNTEKTDKANFVPRWDLSSIYDGFDGKKYEAATFKVLEGIKELMTLAEETEPKDFNVWLKKWLEIENKVSAEYTSLYAYAEAISSCDTTNTEALNKSSFLEKTKLLLDIAKNNSYKILKNNLYGIDKFLINFPEYKEYEFILNERIEEQEHLMSTFSENLAQDLQRNCGNAWGRLQGQIISNLVDKETGKTFNQLRNDAYSDNRELRKDSYEREIQLLKDSEISLAACLNNLKGATNTLNGNRKWNNAIDRSLFSARITEKTLESLIGAIEKSLPFWRKYLKVKAQHVNGTNACAFYDIFAPLPCKEGHIEEKKWTFEESKNYILERYYSFSEDMGNFAKKAFENKWIDAEVRKGKVGGAFCTSMPAQKESRVLTNFTGVFDDNLTLAHELGHAYHDSCINHKDYLLTEYPMTLAETASTFAETIVMKDMISKSSGYEKAKLCENNLSGGFQVLVDILSRFYFEKAVMDKKAEGIELGAKDFCDLMLEAQNKTYGEGLNDVKHPYMWALKVHYYSPDLDFYNFPYAFGQLFALALYSRYEKEGKSFTNVYKRLLSKTGSNYCENICAEAGFDIETEEFWMSGIKQYEKDLEVLEKY